MADTYEMLGATRCDATLPVNHVVEEHTFGQFVTLAMTLDGVSRPISMLDPAGPSDGIEKIMRLIESSAIPLEVAVGDISSKGLLVEHSTVEVAGEALDRLLADGDLDVDGAVAKVGVISATAKALLSGRPAGVIATTADGPRPVTVVPPPPTSTAPAVTRFEIDDLSTFVANPVVPGVDDRPFNVTLTQPVMSQLRQKGSAQLKSQGMTLDLVVAMPDGTAAPSSASEEADVERVRDGVPRVERPPAVPQAALFLPWKQRWELLGYSRGALLHSLSLAPQEETTIELFTWDRRKRALEQESDTETDQTFERADVTKDTTDVINELTNSGEFQAQADARVKVTYPAVQAEVGGQLSRKDNVSQVAKRTSQHLAESTTKAATRVKTRRTTKITESTELGREERVTRKVRNANMCHTLNLDHFEVVANYNLVTEFADEDAAICVLIEMPMEVTGIDFADPRAVRVYERALRAALLDPGLAAGFDAAKLLASRDRAKQVVCDKVRCPDREPPRPPDRPDGADGGERPPAVPPGLDTALTDVTDAARGLSSASFGPLMEAWRRFEAWRDGDPTHRQTTLLGFRKWLYWALLQRLLPSLATALGAPANTTIATVARILSALPGQAAIVQPANVGDQREERSRVIWPVVNQYSWGVVNDPWWWAKLEENGAVLAYDNGLASALDRLAAAHTSAQRSTQLPPEQAALQGAHEQQAIDTDNDRLEYSFPLREVADAQERLDALLEHLVLHKSYYRYAILQAKPLGDQMQLLAGSSAPLELCEPRVIGLIQGARGAPDHVAVPLNLALVGAGEDVTGRDRSFVKLREFVDAVVEELELTEVAGRRVTLPTPGVMVESRVGNCDACEDFIAQSRELDLEQRRQQMNTTRVANTLQEAEVRRYEARLAANPPQLDDPDPGSDGVRVRLDPIRATVEQPPKPPS